MITKTLINKKIKPTHKVSLKQSELAHILTIPNFARGAHFP